MTTSLSYAQWTPQSASTDLGPCGAQGNTVSMPQNAYVNAGSTAQPYTLLGAANALRFDLGNPPAPVGYFGVVVRDAGYTKSMRLSVVFDPGSVTWYLRNDQTNAIAGTAPAAPGNVLAVYATPGIGLVVALVQADGSLAALGTVPYAGGIGDADAAAAAVSLLNAGACTVTVHPQAAPIPLAAGTLTPGTPTATTIPLSVSAASGGVAPYTYDLSYRAPGASYVTVATGVALGALPAAIVGLTPATTYQLLVVEHDAAGTAATDTAVQVTTAPAPVVVPPVAPPQPAPVATLTATPRDVTGLAIEGRRVQWRSLNPAIASVDQAGGVTPHAMGVTYVIATVRGLNARVVTRRCKVTVTA